MSTLILTLALLQAGHGEDILRGEPRTGFEIGAVFLHLDSAIGAKDGLIQGEEAAFRMSLVAQEFTVGMRAYYRRWDITFEEFNRQPADLDGTAQELGLDLIVTYPIARPLSVGVELGGGGLRLEHDLDKETDFFVEGGGFVRLELPAGFHVEASGQIQFALTEFGGQDPDTDHVSWAGRVTLGFEIKF
ncbi:MAG TPA: hypothetical protein VK661_05945 [Planctomycetota bacterium]|nr:hypothetical protein [Planctomycetota bacterium]